LLVYNRLFTRWNILFANNFLMNIMLNMNEYMFLGVARTSTVWMPNLNFRAFKYSNILAFVRTDGHTDMARSTRLEILINNIELVVVNEKEMARSTRLVVLIKKIIFYGVGITCVSKYIARSTRLVMLIKYLYTLLFYEYIYIIGSFYLSHTFQRI